MKCDTAIIAVAGYGTRMLPITKAIEKCMLPIGTRPVIDYVVHDCIAAGVNHIVFVVGEQSTQLQTFYSHNILLEQYLHERGKKELLELVQPPKEIRFTYIVQPSTAKYGTAIPIALARPFVARGQSALVFMGDDCIWHDTDTSSATELQVALQPGEAAILGVPIGRESVSQYGVIDCDEHGVFRRIVEKPTPQLAPSNLINVSKYVMPSTLLDEVVRYGATEQPGEYYITEPINAWVANGGLLRVVETTGTYLDAGTPSSWAAANVFVASQSM